MGRTKQEELLYLTSKLTTKLEESQQHGAGLKTEAWTNGTEERAQNQTLTPTAT